MKNTVKHSKYFKFLSPPCQSKRKIFSFKSDFICYNANTTAQYSFFSYLVYASTFNSLEIQAPPAPPAISSLDIKLRNLAFLHGKSNREIH